MPRAISFVWTSAPLVADAKTVTRRDWSPAYARSFSAGELVNAYEWPTNSPKTDSPSPAAT